VRVAGRSATAVDPVPVPRSSEPRLNRSNIGCRLLQGFMILVPVLTARPNAPDWRAGAFTGLGFR
jgi:hypothetical protein